MSTNGRTVQPDPRLGAVLKSWSLAGSVCVTLAGGLVLLGWAIDNQLLKSLFYGPLTIKANTAVALLLAGVSLRLALTESVTPWLHAAQQAAALAVGLIGVVTVAQDLTGWHFGVDQFLFPDTGAAFVAGSPGRMSPKTAALLSVCGLALWFVKRGPREGVRRAQVLATLACGLAFLALLGHLYGVSHLVRGDSYTHMALPMVAMLLVLSLSILCARPSSGMMAVITDRRGVGVLVRRFLPVAILGPPTFGWLGLLGERAGLYEDAFGSILVAVANISTLTVTGWIIVRAFSRTDVQRQNAETALIKAEVLQRAIFNSPTFSSIATDAQGVIQVFNVGAERMLGYSAEEVVDLITPADISDPDELVARAGALTVEFQTPISSGFDALAFKASRGIEDIYELTYIRKDGQRVPAVVSVTVLRDASHTIIGYLLIGTDNTARKLVDDERLRLEQLLRDQNRDLEEAGRALDAQFRHANKMDAIGQLAAGVAHDFNNLLTVILGFSELLASESKLTPKDLRDMTEIIKAARRAAELTKQLLAFSRQHPPRLTAVDLNALVTDMSGMLDRLIGQHITVSLALTPELTVVIADRGQMEQVVMNLVVNARDAMEAGGSITIETAVIDMPDTVVGERVLSEGRYVRLAISDTGAGMNDETLAHLFDPFFTTKAVGKGTGLGLSTVAGIIVQIKGHIHVDSAVGRGTTFTMYMPVSMQATALGRTG